VPPGKATATAPSTSTPAGRVVVPEVVGSPLPMAETTLSEVGLGSTVKTVPNQNEPGQDCAAKDVVAQLPEPGSEVPHGSLVNLVTCALP
jgi:beta-lactam-binding protein with PASTA domain